MTAEFKQVLLAHGGGGELMNRLIREHIIGPLRNDALAGMTDGAILPWNTGQLVFTTDSYVVTPVEFPGGDIGRLAVCGTVNDLAVMGAEPVALSLALILEEGLELAVLDRIVASIAAAAREAGVQIVTGDTKVIERRSANTETSPGLFINTAGVGWRRPGSLVDVRRVTAGDAILLTAPIAEHGLAIMSVRNGVEFESTLRTDAAPLNGLLRELFTCGADVKFVRDATRGGVASVLCDICEGAGLSVEIDESRLPLTPAARHAAEMLGLDALAVANEGVAVVVVAQRDARRALGACRAHLLGRRAVIIGSTTESAPALVELVTRIGGRRVVQRPYGEDLPRIC